MTRRSVGSAVLTLSLNAYWQIQMEVVRYSAHPATVRLLSNAIFRLLVLTGIKALVARRMLWRATMPSQRRASSPATVTVRSANALVRWREVASSRRAAMAALWPPSPLPFPIPRQCP